MQTFLPWSDYAYYAFVPNGGLEQGATGWTLSGGAKVVAGNEAFDVTSDADAYSLSLPAGSSATSAPMCIGLLSSKMRFFVRNTGNAASRLKVQVVYRGGLGSVLGIFDAGSIGAGGTWSPSPEVSMLGGVLPLLTQYVQFRVSPADSTGDWQLDDFYMDPIMHG